ncbi:ABC transporter substrate-binding protein [Roseomonas sp. CCTCC AB2023176]|uniref:ABC transporter substrate-binding protein n=1 Tax=Roseomonas sp. CCTCC AB2023176 TaxID=3342640 RepID=UPI0035D6A4D5
MRPTLPRRLLLSAAVGTATAAVAQTPPSQSNELRVGAVFPLSGPLALLGDRSFRGVELAVEERNAAGGLLSRPIRLLRGDAPEAAAAVAETRRLMGTERVAFLFGTYGSSLAFAATQAAELQGTPYFELGAIADNVTERGFRNVYRFCPRASDFARVTVEAVESVLTPLLGQPAPRVGLLHEDGLYGTAVSAFQADRLRERGLALAERVGYPTRSTDLTGAIGRLRASGADVVLHTAYQNDATLFFRTLRETGWAPRMIIGAGAGYSLTETARTVGRAFEGVMNVDFTPFEIAERAAPGAALFAEAYRRQYGSDPRSGHSLVNYAGARVFLDAVQRAGAPDKDRIRAAVLATDIPEAATPAGWGARFDERGQNLRAQPWLMQWQAGKLVTIHPEGAAVARPRPTIG